MITPRPVARLALALPLLVGCSTGALKEGSPITRESVSFEERLLATIPGEWESVRDSLFFISPNGRSVAYLVQLTGELDEQPRSFIVLDGQKQVEVGVVGLQKDCFLVPEVIFSPDSKRTAYAFYEGNAFTRRLGVMVDGRKGPIFDKVGDPVFSPNGLQFAYEAEEAGKQVVVINHKVEGRPFDKAEHPVFSPDGRRCAYRASTLAKADNDGWRKVVSAFIVVDGIKGPEFDWVGWPVFVPRSNDVAYAAKKNGVYRIIQGDGKSDGFDYLGDPAFSPDGRRMACVAGRGGRFFILVDGREFDARFPAYGDPFFSPDGKHFAYLGFRDVIGTAIEEQPPLPDVTGRTCMVVDGEEGEDGDFIWQPRFGPKGERLLYEVHQEREEFVVFGREKLGREFAGVAHPVASLDGSKCAFVATIRDEGAVVVCGDQRSEPFDSIPGAPVFSPDGKRLAFGARKGRELWWKVMEVK